MPFYWSAHWKFYCSNSYQVHRRLEAEFGQCSSFAKAGFMLKQKGRAKWLKRAVPQSTQLLNQGGFLCFSSVNHFPRGNSPFHLLVFSWIACLTRLSHQLSNTSYLCRSSLQKHEYNLSITSTFNFPFKMRILLIVLTGLISLSTQLIKIIFQYSLKLGL